MRILDVPQDFMRYDRVKYPPHNDMTLDEYCFSALKNIEVKTDLLYVPIMWTNYYVRHSYAGDQPAVKKLSDFCHSIKEPWFTICQYDDGILVKEEQPENCTSFCAGGKGTHALPLTSFAWPDSDARFPQKYLASFLGNTNTHGIRKVMMDKLSGKPGFSVEHVGGHRTDYKTFMLSSAFALCPRGYGITSFRLYEAMQMGTIPVYISNDPWVPFKEYVDWNKFCLFCNDEEISNLPDRLAAIPASQVVEMSAAAKKVWHDYFSYPACALMIKRILEETK